MQAHDKVVCEVNVASYNNSQGSASYRAIYGARNGSYGSNANAFFTRFGGSDKPVYCRTGKETSGSNFIYDRKLTLTTQDNLATWTDGTSTYSITTNGTVNDCVNNLFIFNINTGSGANSRNTDISWDIMKLYSFKLYNSSNELVRDYIPVHNTITNSVGLYDKIEGKFYPNNGTGAFTPGPEKVSE